MSTDTDSKKNIFGYGTGRCGSTSLAKLLSSQDNSEITHETPFPLPWKPNLTQFREYYKRITARNGHFVGEISYSWLNYIDLILETNSNSKIVGLVRDKDSVVNSLFTKCSKNLWTEGVHRNHKYYCTFPKAKKGTPKKEAIEIYYDIYMEKMLELESTYSKNIRLFRTEDLNIESKVLEILSFCEFDQPKVITGIKLNV